MSKRDIDTDIGMPSGDAYQTNIVHEVFSPSSVPQDAGSTSFMLTLNTGGINKFSITYDVKSHQKRRANLQANRRSRAPQTDQE